MYYVYLKNTNHLILKTSSIEILKCYSPNNVDVIIY